MANYVIGVDVGTGSARAGVFDLQGHLLASASTPIETWKPRPNFVEQSSDDIWNAIAVCIRLALGQAQIPAEQVGGISFDATCSLVALDRNHRPLTVDLEGDPRRNIIVWMDHRALHESEIINSGDYEVLRYVGGGVSPEMETPKLKWIKANLPQTWTNAGKFLDLADFLTYRATGIDARSLCTVTCKWTYLGHEGEHGQWDRSFLRAIEIEDAFDDQRIVNDVRPMGSFLGRLTSESAHELGLTTDCVVGVGIIDAHAGGLGLLGAVWSDSAMPDLSLLETALALIGGTSNCHMAVSQKPQFIPGIWGPYYGAMVPGMWLTEGGQSSAGSAIDFVIADHANSKDLKREADHTHQTVYQVLNQEIERLRRAENLPYSGLLTRNLHIRADFLGNRSPHANPYAAGVIDGMTLDESLTSQALRYYATLQAVAYGTRDIVEAMNQVGFRIDTLFVTGGGTKNPLWLQEHADATGLTLILPEEPEAVLLGTAILAATAMGAYDDIPAAMKAMSRRGNVIQPDPSTASYHAAKFSIYREMYDTQQRRREIMSSFVKE